MKNKPIFKNNNTGEVIKEASIDDVCGLYSYSF